MNASRSRTGSVKRGVLTGSAILVLFGVALLLVPRQDRSEPSNQARLSAVEPPTSEPMLSSTRVKSQERSRATSRAESPVDEGRGPEPSPNAWLAEMNDTAYRAAYKQNLETLTSDIGEEIATCVAQAVKEPGDESKFIITSFEEPGLQTVNALVSARIEGDAGGTGVITDVRVKGANEEFSECLQHSIEGRVMVPPPSGVPMRVVTVAMTPVFEAEAPDADERGERGEVWEEQTPLGSDEADRMGEQMEHRYRRLVRYPVFGQWLTEFGISPEAFFGAVFSEEG